MRFFHSGDVGDIIFSLPCVRMMGGGEMCLDENGGSYDPLVNNALFFDKGKPGHREHERRTRLDVSSIEAIRPVLEQQPYVQKVTSVNTQHAKQLVDVNLNAFRIYLGEGVNIVESHIRPFLPCPVDPTLSWLTCEAPADLGDRPILISRTLRCHGNDEFWNGLRPETVDHAQFVGLPFEYDVFCRTFSRIRVPHLETKTTLDLFNAVAGADQVISNQGLVHTFAEGLKKNLVLEVYRNHSRCVFERPGAQYV